MKVGVSTVVPEHFEEAGARRAVRLGLGLLWILDACLQLQPAMFTRAVLVDSIWASAAQGEPHWLASLVGWSISLASPHLTAFNWGIAIVQFVIGALLLTGRPLPARLGLWASAAFALAVWLFGEGMGQILAGGATLLSGAPGSTFVYLVASLLLLLPPGTWAPTARRRATAPALALGLLLLLCGALQLQHTFWTGLGLAAPFGQMFKLPQPGPLRTAVGVAATVADAAPTALNGLFVAALFGCGLLLLDGDAERHPLASWAVLGLLAAVWILGQDAGMLFSGMATDPNSAPPLALLLAGTLAARRGPASLTLPWSSHHRLAHGDR